MSSEQSEKRIVPWFDPAMYALGTFIGPGLITLTLEAPRFQSMALWKIGMFVMLGAIMWLAGVQGLALSGDGDD